jgi:hypothetical protein
MKTITIILSIVAITGCTNFKETTRQAKMDWYNFNKTIQLNLNQPAVYSKNHF